MARFAYFADLPNGETLEWRSSFERHEDRFGQLRSREILPRINHFKGVAHGYDADRGWVRITRQVRMKPSPSRHVCDHRCIYAKGRTMNCECSCGGANHGKGGFLCEAA